MATKRRKRGKGMNHGQEHESVFQDRISELPDGIILHILSLLPTIDAVRTGLLSKRWRRMWALIPVLDFCDSRDIDDFRRDDHDETNIGQKKFDMFVDECFAHTYAGASISKFKLDVIYYGCRRRLDGWLRFPMKKNVQELDLSVQPEGRSARISLYCLPHFILHLGALTLLKLSGVVLETPVPSSLPSLKELHLVSVRMTDHVLNNLVFGCPSLEKLHVHYCDGLLNPKVSSLSMKSMEFITSAMHSYCRTIKVEAINLHSLKLSGAILETPVPSSLPSLKELHLVSVRMTDQVLNNLVFGCPSLEKLHVHYCGGLLNPKVSSLSMKSMEFITGERYPRCQAIKVEAINLHSFKLSGVVLETTVPSSLPSLKELHLVFVRMTDHVLNNLVFGCPSLEKLHVHYCDGLLNPKVSSLSMKSMEFITGEMHSRCQTIKVEAINLHSFKHTGSFSCKLYMNLVHCRTIRNLSLMGASITDQWLEDLIPQLPLLESLKLTNCYRLQNLKIGNQHLKDFALTWRHPKLGLLDTTIDAPNLVSFSYYGFSFFKISVNAPNLLDVAIRVPDPFRKTYDAEWHTSLIKFLSEFNGSKNVSVVCSYEQALIIPDEVTDMYSSPLPDLKHMKVQIDGQLFSKAMLRKSLLWIAPSNLETLPIG